MRQRLKIDAIAEELIAKGIVEGKTKGDLLMMQDIADWFGVSYIWVVLGRTQGYGPKEDNVVAGKYIFKRESVIAWLRERAKVYAMAEAAKKRAGEGKEKKIRPMADAVELEGPLDEMLTTNQVANLIKMSSGWLTRGRLLKHGPKFVRTKVPRSVRYRRGDVIDWMKENGRYPVREGDIPVAVVDGEVMA